MRGAGGWRDSAVHSLERCGHDDGPGSGPGAGMGIAKLLVPIFFEHVRDNDLTFPLIVHGGTWAGIGTVAGLALAIGLGGGWVKTLRLIVGCAMAAPLAAIIYDLVGATAFPLAMTDRPVSMTWQTRLFARLIVAVLIAAGAVLAREPVAKCAARSAQALARDRMTSRCRLTVPFLCEDVPRGRGDQKAGCSIT